MADHGSHSHQHGHHHTPQNAGDLKIALLLNVSFTLIEIAGGFWTNSIAILSDSLHDAGDSFSLALAWYLQRLSNRQPSARFSYGYRRFSTFGALITSLVLIAGLSVVAWNALERLQQPQSVRAPAMMLLAVIGILFNGYAAWRLRGSNSLNTRIASWHLIEDTLGWAAVLVGSIAISIWNLPIIDPLLSLAISLFVIWNVVKNLRPVLLVLLQSAPPGFDPASIDQQLRALPHVTDTHHTHTWTLDGERHVFSTHLVLKPETTRDDIITITQSVQTLLADRHFEHITVGIELEGEPCPQPQTDSSPTHSQS